MNDRNPEFPTATPSKTGPKSSAVSTDLAISPSALPRIDVAADPSLYLEMGLNHSEYRRIVEVLGREPTYTELGMYAVMWSEHCGYKYSRPVLRLFQKYRESMEKGSMENAGVVPIGDGLGVVFKMESHNHPSAVEPFQGAATGVGGILRDIFTMGARPIASMDSIRFGPLSDGRTRFLFNGVVEGIAWYGNCLTGDESLVWRDRAGQIQFDTIGAFVECAVPLVAVDGSSLHGMDALTFDPITHRSCWRPIRRVYKRRAKELLCLKMTLGRSLKVTPDHPVFLLRDGKWQVIPARNVVKGDRIPLIANPPDGPGLSIDDTSSAPSIDLIEAIRNEPALTQGVFVSLPQGWQPSPAVRAALLEIEPSPPKRFRYLRSGYLPFDRFLQLEALLSIDRSQLTIYRHGPRSNRISAVITPDVRFARMIGYYLAEGCVSQNRSTDKVIFSFSRHEEDYVQDVAEALRSLGVTPRFEKRESTLVVYGSSWLLGHLLRNILKCGTGSAEKSFPSVVFEWPRYLQHEALKGLLRSDGSWSACHRGNHARVSFATISRRLFEQTVMLLHNEGVIPGIYMRKGGKSSIQGRETERLPLWTLEINNWRDLEALSDLYEGERKALYDRELARYTCRDRSYPRCHLKDGTGVIAVTSVEPVPVPGDGEDVYDIEVEDTHLFITTGGIITHNCVGVPTVGGETVFHPSYAGNPLVNAMAVGLVRIDRIATAAAGGIGNPVLLVGSRTGRDGIHACSVLASAELSEQSLANRPAVQAGDPFTEKLLIEATLEALATGHIVGIQDMGAAGITCSTCETAAKGGVGMTIDVLKVPRREEGMTPYEVMLSESQERMLAIVQSGHEEEVAGIFHKWGLNAVRIGEITDDGFVTVMEGELQAARVPAKSLADECPTYTLETHEPESIRRLQEYDLSSLPEPDDWNDVMRRLLSSPGIASKSWVWSQYDHMVQDNTVILPGSDAAVIRIKPTDAGAVVAGEWHESGEGSETGHYRGLAITTDCNSRYCALDPYQGARLAVAEAARNLSCSGADPKGVTDCLNFGNPEKPEVFWQFRRAVEGLASACEAFGTPVVSGNVSFYNETPESAVYPTPTVGMVGVLDDVGKRCSAGFQGDGDAILLFGPSSPKADRPFDGMGGSEYLSVIHGVEAGEPPCLEIELEKRLQSLVRNLIQTGFLRSAHDCSDGGFAIAIAESAILGGRGATVHLPDPESKGESGSVRAVGTRMSWRLFSEAQSRVVATAFPDSVREIERQAAESGVSVTVVGAVGGNRLTIHATRHAGPGDAGVAASPVVDLSLVEASSLWRDSIPNVMN